MNLQKLRIRDGLDNPPDQWAKNHDRMFLEGWLERGNGRHDSARCQAAVERLATPQEVISQEMARSGRC